MEKSVQIEWQTCRWWHIPGIHKVCAITQCQPCLSVFLSQAWLFNMMSKTLNQGVEDVNHVKADLCQALYTPGFSFRSRPLIAAPPETIVLSIGTIETKFREEESDTAIQISLNCSSLSLIGFKRLYQFEQNLQKMQLLIETSGGCREAQCCSVNWNLDLVVSVPKVDVTK